jgi:hypothetical protein
MKPLDFSQRQGKISSIPIKGISINSGWHAATWELKACFKTGNKDRDERLLDRIALRE